MFNQDKTKPNLVKWIETNVPITLHTQAAVLFDDAPDNAELLKVFYFGKRCAEEENLAAIKGRTAEILGLRSALEAKNETTIHIKSSPSMIPVYITLLIVAYLVFRTFYGGQVLFSF